MFNPKSLTSGKQPTIFKATAEDFYLWERDNSYLPATSNHEYFNVVDFSNKNDVELSEYTAHDLTYSPDDTVKSFKGVKKFRLVVDSNRLYALAKSKFDEWYTEDLKKEVNSEIIDSPVLEKIEYTKAAEMEIQQLAYLAYKALKRNDPNWYKLVNDAWARERTEYLYKGKKVLIDNKIAELVSTTALCARPEKDKLVIIYK